jgi:membrane peptidoglycan carboxypeptidase
MGDPTCECSMSNVGGRSVFGATYPAEIWKAFMEAAHTNLPVVDFIEPNEDLWPTPGRIDEFGRVVNSYSSRNYDPPETTTTIATVTPATNPTPTTKAPPIVAPTTSPPPTSKPPVTAPDPTTGP